MVKVLDTGTYIVVWTTTPFGNSFTCLTAGADIEYVLVKPAVKTANLSLLELLNELSEKFGWTYGSTSVNRSKN